MKIYKWSVKRFVNEDHAPDRDGVYYRYYWGDKGIGAFSTNQGFTFGSSYSTGLSIWCPQFTWLVVHYKGRDIVNKWFTVDIRNWFLFTWWSLKDFVASKIK